jgi:hypothetical protein
MSDLRMSASRSAEQIAEVKALARKITNGNDAAQFVELALRMHRLLDEFLRNHLRRKVN